MFSQNDRLFIIRNQHKQSRSSAGNAVTEKKRIYRNVVEPRPGDRVI